VTQLDRELTGEASLSGATPCSFSAPLRLVRFVADTCSPVLSLLSDFRTSPRPCLSQSDCLCSCHSFVSLFFLHTILFGREFFMAAFPHHRLSVRPLSVGLLPSCVFTSVPPNLPTSSLPATDAVRWCTSGSYTRPFRNGTPVITFGTAVIGHPPRHAVY
jgi:hypothetical protein